MADKAQTEQFLKSWWEWRSGLPQEQRWMADAMAWSATQSADVQGYQAEWSWDKVGSWIGEQDATEWQQWSQNWKEEAWWGKK